ncbi:MAG: GIDE domain-containing protein [Paracoccaceae bacterium]
MSAIADFLKDASFGVFAFTFGIPLALSAAMAAGAIWARRNARALAALSPASVDLVTGGVCLATGRVDGKAGAKAPLTGRACAWAEAVVEESRLNNATDRSDREYRWQEVFSETTRRPIRFGWNGGAASADPEGATVFHAGWSEWYGPQERPGDRDPEIRPGTMSIGEGRGIEVMSDPKRRFRYRERYIFAGDPVFVLGEAREAKGALLIGPAEGRPFLISTRSPEDIGTESALAFKAGIAMSGLFLALAALVAALRFG